MLINLCPVFSQNSGLEQAKKDAGTSFEAEDYSKAYKLYSLLVANFPKDAEYNYKLGVCMIYSEPDKKKSLPYLIFASKNGNAETKDVLFYLGKAYHINYLFDEAIKNYNAYKKTASPAGLKKLPVDREIKACNNGKHLLSNMSDLVVQSKKELNESDYFRSYDLKDMGGKLLVKPEDFNSALDKKKKDKSVVFLPKAGKRVYYSSYGGNTGSGKDIYFSEKQADGNYSSGKKVLGINTEFDEDYPFLHPNGKTLYFASKGHNSMGGYDIFKSSYLEATDSWSTPVNLEFPINSPDDDYLFVTDSLEKNAYFTTGRQSPPGKTDVLKISTERKPIDLVVVQGKVAQDQPEQSLKSKISIKNLDTKKEAGVYYAEENGDYQLNLGNGAKVLITVETPGFKTQTQEITLPLAETSKPYEQTISYTDGILKISNNFDAPTTDNNYLQYLNVIEKKAKLDVNEGENQIVSKTSVSDSLNTQNKSPQLIKKINDSAAVANTPKPGLDNSQLANMAKEDAILSKNEAVQLKQDSNDALEVGQAQKVEAEKKLGQANEAIKNTEAIENADEKKQALDKAMTLKQEAENEDALADKILDLAKSLNSDASAKEKEASLNEQYAIELEKAINLKNNDKTTAAKLEAMQKQITELSAQKKSSENLLNSIKTNAEEKQKQITALENTKAEVKTSLQEIKTEISDNDAQLASTRKKKDKEIIVNQTNELKIQQSEKETQLAEKELEIKKLNNDLVGLKSELDIANKIKNEIIAPLVTPLVSITQTSLTAKTETQTSIANNQKPETTNTTLAVNINNKEVTKNDYAPLTANTGAEAVSKLDKLSSQLNGNDNELFDFNSYQNQQAQSLKIEADAKINDATIQQKKLKELISASKGSFDIKTQANFTPAQLAKEGDDLQIKAQGLRKQAAKLSGEAKTAKLAEVKVFETQADEKYLQAAEVTKNDNKSIFETNQINIKALSSENNMLPAEIAEINSLNDDLMLSFKKADELRSEAANLPSLGAKLGNLSNAEEIEAESLLEQQSVLSRLQKKNPSFVLKPAITSAEPPTVDTSSGGLNSKLQTVNEGVYELANIKIASFQKLFDANAIEAQETFVNIAKNQTLLNKTPGLKSDFISGSSKITNAASFKQKSDSSLNTNDKLNNLTAAIKKQIEAIKQLSALNSALNQAALRGEATLAKQNQQKSNIIVANKNDIVVKGSAENTDTLSVANGKIVEVAELALQDTTAGQIVNYFSAGSLSLINTQALSSAKKSIETINSSEIQIKALENKINNPTTSDAAVNPTGLKEKSIKLSLEAEQLNVKAAEVRQQAEEKTGTEKDSLLTAAAEIEDELTQKKLEAAQLSENANVSETASNNIAIAEMLVSLKNDNAELYAEFNFISKELFLLEDKTKKLREEANNQTSSAAKLGAISNAEEKEAELLIKQKELIVVLKKQYPNYEVKPYNPATSESPEILSQQKTQLREKQYSEFTNLTNAFSLDFEASKTNVPLILSNRQSAIKKNAEELNTESKRLLIEATKEADENKKIKLFALSAKSGEAANAQLAKLIPKQQSVIAEATSKASPKTKKSPKNSNTDPYATFTDKNIEGAENKSVSEIDSVGAVVVKPLKKKTIAPKDKAIVKTTNTAKTKFAKNTIKIDGLEVTKGNAYSESKPIPLDSKIEDWLVFRVQVGAFKNKLPNDAFKGLSPLNGETAGNGYTRYTAGNFKKVENANAVKNDLRSLGYSDAFVVVFFNGKRISLNEALTMMEKEGKTIDNNAPQTAGITANTNIPRVQVPSPLPTALLLDNTVVVSKELEKIDGLLYTVQIGVYTKQITKRQLLNLSPIFTERLSNGLYRYTAGIYNNPDRLISDKRKVVELGVKDAFASAYLNGKRIPFAEGKTKQTEDGTVKMEAEDPIIFEGAGITEDPLLLAANIPTIGSSPLTNTVQPFKNNVTIYPEATAENGIKIIEEGVTFKVQIGAYSRQVPNDVAAKYSAITTWPIENKQIKGLFIYTIGSFSSAKFAKTLREEAVRLGINDAFISVYDDGIKLYGDAASTELLK